MMYGNHFVDGIRRAFAVILAVTLPVLLASCGSKNDGIDGGVEASGSVTTNPRFAYVANAFSHTISVYYIDVFTGQPRNLGYVFAGNTPRSVAVHPSGRFAYVANAGSHDISAFNVHPTTGGLLLIGTVDSTGSGPMSVTIDPSGRFAYIANFFTNDVSVFRID